MIFAIGEILIDRFPGYEREGGAPFNFAYHLKYLGLPVRLISRVGDDEDGRRLLKMLSHHGFDPSDIQVDPKHPTGVVNVALDDQGVPSFDILADVAYDYLAFESLPEDRAGDASLIYYGSLIQRSKHGYDQLGALLGCRPFGTKCFCDINLRVPHYSRASIMQSLTGADILKINDQELEEIRHILDNPVASETFAEYLMSFFNLELLAITRGAGGSTLMNQKQIIDIPPATADVVVDTVGAGDAYAAMLALGTLLSLPLDATARACADFAARICRLPGAVPENTAFYDRWKTRWGEYR